MNFLGGTLKPYLRGLVTCKEVMYELVFCSKVLRQHSLLFFASAFLPVYLSSSMSFLPSFLRSPPSDFPPTCMHPSALPPHFTSLSLCLSGA
mmetsp:Transcript_39434/g.77605  ORF Transcript_39434/g.77605 Transcript_39434/m.77605 type:complete len:92 (+) Transcript_39434:596-871(+)